MQVISYYSSDQNRKDEMGEVCSMNGGYRNVHGLWGNLKERDSSKGKGIDGRMTVNLVLKK